MSAAPRLNENQQRVLEVTLRLLEERLAELRRLLENDERGQLYVRMRPEFSVPTADEVAGLIEDLRAGIRGLAIRFGLDAEEQSARRQALGLLSIAWQSLGEVTARRMRAYGPVDPALAGALDPAIEHMMQVLGDLEIAIARSAGADADR